MKYLNPNNAYKLDDLASNADSAREGHYTLLATHSLLLGCIVALMALIASPLRAQEQKRSNYMPNNVELIAKAEAKAANIDYKLVLAILAHESHNCQLPTTTATDLGCMQISRETAIAMGLDLYRLVVDRRYNIKAGVSVLTYLQFQFHNGEPKTWYCRYNIGTGFLDNTNMRNCRKYLSRVKYAIGAQ